MAKKGKKFETTEEQNAAQTETQTAQTAGTDGEANASASQTETTEGEKSPAVPRSFHLLCETADVTGRTQYRFAKYSLMPKKAPRMPVMVDGEETEMAVTNSGGYATVKGFNGYLAARGFVGWILFSDGVDPMSAEQFPDGIVFTTVDGTCPANPIREPANPENEMKRREAATIAAKKRAEDRKAAEAATEGTETTETATTEAAQ
jgi:hypothetical protein